MIKVTEKFVDDGSRYALDFGACDYKRGFAQMDTDQDAGYFGQWANPTRLVVVCYAEGDLTVSECETGEEFVGLVRRIAEFHGEGFKGVDGMCEEGIIGGFEALGLGDLLH